MVNISATFGIKTTWLGIHKLGYIYSNYNYWELVANSNKNWWLSIERHSFKVKKKITSSEVHILGLAIGWLRIK